MKISTIILGILFFAIATMIIYGWGIIRQKNQSGDLMKILFSKGQARVKKYVKMHGAITLGQAAKLCEAFGAGLFFGFFEVFAVALFVEGIACAVYFARCAAQEAAVRAAVAPARVVRDPAGAADAVPHVDVEA